MLPQFIRQAPAGTQYVHDATSLLITDQRTTQCALGHNPCEVYVDFNENTVDLWDVTDKAQPVMLSSTTYADVSFTHSGWPSADQRSIFVHDELEALRDAVRGHAPPHGAEADEADGFILCRHSGSSLVRDQIEARRRVAAINSDRRGVSTP